jgi:glycosyltransferase involved in cell wall biosynthesis
MKILNINYSELEGGAAIACNRLHNAFLQNRINSLLLVNRKITKSKTVVEINNHFFLKKFFSKILNLFLNNFEKSYHSVSYFNSNILNAIKEIDPDIVHLNWVCNEMISIEEIAKIQKPIVWTFQDMWAFTGTEHYTSKNNYNHNNKKIINYDLFSYLANWTWKRKKISFKENINIVCNTKWMKMKVINSSIFYKKKNISIIPNCLDFKIWKPFNRKSSREYLKLIYQKKYIIFSSSNGTSDERKGFEFLLKAIELLEIKDLHLIIVGQLSNYHKNIIPIDFTVFDKINPQNIILLRRIYSASDLIVAPSTLESFGQVVVEAASCNVPAVVFQNTGLSNVIEHKKTGYIAKYKDYKDLSNGIRWCLKKKYVGNSVRNYSEKYFSTNIVCKKYLKKFKKILEL